MSGRGATHEATCPVGLGVDAACAADARYFELSPRENNFIRPATWAERVELGIAERGAWIKVAQVASGVRFWAVLR